MHKMLIIDGLNLVRRLYSAQGDSTQVTKIQDEQQALLALSSRTCSACQKLIQYHQPSHAAIIWDGNALSWRKKLFTDYKKGRKPMPSELAKMLPQLKLHLTEDHINSIDAESEADDVIATLATKLAKGGVKSVIVSTDKGFTQLKDELISCWDYFNKTAITIEQRESQFGVDHSQFIDYLALAGDSGNKISGVPGIGPKSAMELLRTYRSLSNIYANIDKIGAKQAKKLQAGYQLAKISYLLVQLKLDIPLNTNLNQFRLPVS